MARSSFECISQIASHGYVAARAMSGDCASWCIMSVCSKAVAIGYRCYQHIAYMGCSDTRGSSADEATVCFNPEITTYDETDVPLCAYSVANAKR